MENKNEIEIIEILDDEEDQVDNGDGGDSELCPLVDGDKARDYGHNDSDSVCSNDSDVIFMHASPMPIIDLTDDDEDDDDSSVSSSSSASSFSSIGSAIHVASSARSQYRREGNLIALTDCGWVYNSIDSGINSGLSQEDDKYRRNMLITLNTDDVRTVKLAREKSGQKQSRLRAGRVDKRRKGKPTVCVEFTVKI